jgi:hypothetical protein
MFIIQIISDNGKVRYVSEGEYMRYSLCANLQQAKFFATKEDAEEVFLHEEWMKRRHYNDGSSSPPFLLWLGLDISNERPSARGTVKILQLGLTEVKTFAVEDSRKSERKECL